MHSPSAASHHRHRVVERTPAHASHFPSEMGDTSSTPSYCCEAEAAHSHFHAKTFRSHVTVVSLAPALSLPHPLTHALSHLSFSVSFTALPNQHSSYCHTLTSRPFFCISQSSNSLPPPLLRYHRDPFRRPRPPQTAQLALCRASHTYLHTTSDDHLDRIASSCRRAELSSITRIASLARSHHSLPLPTRRGKPFVPP